MYQISFLSWIIIGGIFTSLLSPNTGVVNYIRELFGLEPIYFMASEDYSRMIVVVAGIWKETGWSSIVYLAAISGIDPSLYEAAEVDGANRFRKMISITLPSILPIIMTML